MNQEITSRVELLRQYMKENNLSAFIIPSTDAHAGEYVPQHWEARKWISGFTGSAGTAVVTLSKAALWTDSRYFLSAEEELAGTPFSLMKEKTESYPTIEKWLLAELNSNETVGIDGWTSTHAMVAQLEEELSTADIHLRHDLAPMDSIWTSRTPLPLDKIVIHPIEYAGATVSEKLASVRKAMAENGAEALLVSALDEVAWTTNLRGCDVHCNPVFVSYLLISKDNACLFVEEKKLSDEVREQLKKAKVDIDSYDNVKLAINNLKFKSILLPTSTNEALFSAVPKNINKIVTSSPIAMLKAVKNKTEIDGFHKAMTRDGVALVKFLKWLKPAVEAGGQTEISIDQKLTSLRAEQALFKGISFDTIAAYGPHGAIVHYEATPETNSELHAEGLILIDSGAQYEDGTTDITRTIALGPSTEEQRHIFTLVLKGHIQLSKVRFPEGTNGTQLDICARYAMWQEAINFGHGTGHGVGSYLCVHEGPHQIRMNHMPSPIKAGMTVTDEPGIYLTGKFGVRIENTLLCIPFETSDFGRFYQFEPLTLCPYDISLIERKMLSLDEVAWINNYHYKVRTTLTPLLDNAEERQWLEEATRPIL